MGWWGRWLREIRALLELLLLPGLAALLPWPVAFRVLRWLARCPWLYRDNAAAAWREARRMGHAGEDAKRWLWTYRLVTLVDHADHYLGLTRSDRWMRRHIQVQGQWPAPGQSLLLATFHWGTGYWGLRHQRAHGLRAHALVSPLNPDHFKGQRVLFAYARSRTRHVAKALGTATLDISASMRPVLEALRQEESIIALPDVPADHSAASLCVSLLGHAMHVPRGMMRLATERQLLVCVNHVTMDLQTGQRTLHIEPLGRFDHVQELADTLFMRLAQRIEEQPAFWHLWAQSPRFFDFSPADSTTH